VQSCRERQSNGRAGRAQASPPRVTFGTIVFNGMPFVPYLLRSLYPYAHQIIVVEGAVPLMRAMASPTGHSTDGTLEALRHFASDEDPDRKLVIVTAEDEGHPDGVWPGEKNEMCQAFARRATGDWLWEVDSDEFYSDIAMERMLAWLAEHPQTTAVSFRQRIFWGSPDWYVAGPFFKGSETGGQIYRIFRWQPSWTYATHFPPTVRDDHGRDLRDLILCGADHTEAMGIFFFHYSLLFREQVERKWQYYAARGDKSADPSVNWVERNWMQLTEPFHVHNANRYISWLERHRGPHPREIQNLWADVLAGRITATRRPMEDVAELTRDPVFRVIRSLMRTWPSDEELTKRGRYRWQKTLERLAIWYERRWARRRGLHPDVGLS